MLVLRFNKEIASCRKKSTDDLREESIIENPEVEPITEYSKRTLSLTILKRNPSLGTQDHQ